MENINSGPCEVCGKMVYPPHHNNGDSFIHFYCKSKNIQETEKIEKLKQEFEKVKKVEDYEMEQIFFDSALADKQEFKSGTCELCGHPVRFSPGYDGPMLHVSCRAKKEAKENRQRHLDHPFYKKVDKVVEEIKVEQIIKGSETYEEPFNPHSWRPKQLLWHQMQELRDAQVYGVGLYELLEELEKKFNYMRGFVQTVANIDSGKVPFEYIQTEAKDVLDLMNSEDIEKALKERRKPKGSFIDERV